MQFELKFANLNKSFGGHLLKGKSHELRMCEPKHNTCKCVQDFLAKTRWRLQVVQPALVIKDRIRVTKGQFLM